MTTAAASRRRSRLCAWTSHQSPQMFAEFHRMPPGLEAERFGDHFCRVVTRRAGDIAAGMAGRAAHKKAIDRRLVLAPTWKRAVFQGLIAGVFADHPVTAVHILVMTLDVERRRRIARKNIFLVGIRGKLLPNAELFLEPVVARLVPVQRITPETIGHQLPHERRRFTRRRLGWVVK